MKTALCAGMLALFGFLMQVEPSSVYADASAQVTVNVTMQNIAFNPQNITIHVGDTVKWTNQDPFQHTVTSGVPSNPSGLFNSGTMNPNGTFSRTFNTPGTFAYYCSIHEPSMTGTVTVEPAVNVSEDKNQAEPFVLHQNVPNPFNGETMFSYDLKTQGDVTLTIYSVIGQKIWEQVEHAVAPGHHSIKWNATSATGSSLSTGVYLYTLNYNGMVAVRSMMYMK